MSARVNLTVDTGVPFGYALQWLDAANQPHDLSAAVLVAQVRARFLHEAPDADPVAQFDVTGDDDGWIHLTLPAEQTTDLEPGVYVWDLVVDDATMDPPRRRLARGSVTVTPAVTP